MKNLLYIILFCVIPFQSVNAQNAKPKTYGVILNGAGHEFSNEYRYYQSVTQLHSAYVQSGITKQNIYTLFASGDSKTLDTKKKETTINDVLKFVDAQRKKAEDPNAVIKSDVKDIPGMMFNASSSLKAEGIGVNGSASKGDLKKTFLDIAKKAKSGDLINFYITDHGTPKGEVVSWGLRDKKTNEKDKEDLAYERQYGVPSRTINTLSVNDIKEILKIVPKGVTVQIANNICYGGKLLELTDPDANICVTSLEGPSKFVTSGEEKSDYVERFSKNLKEKNFYESHLDAKNNDFRGNIGSWNSLDYFISSELAKMSSIEAPNKTTEASASSSNTCPVGDNIKNDSDSILKETQMAAAEERLKKMKIDLNLAIKSKKNYLAEGSTYDKKLKNLKEKYENNYKMQAGKNKDAAYKARDLEEKTLREEKETYVQRVTNLDVSAKSIAQELIFLNKASPDQRAKYAKIKNCLERSL